MDVPVAIKPPACAISSAINCKLVGLLVDRFAGLMAPAGGTNSMLLLGGSVPMTCPAKRLPSIGGGGISEPGLRCRSCETRATTLAACTKLKVLSFWRWLGAATVISAGLFDTGVVSVVAVGGSVIGADDAEVVVDGWLDDGTGVLVVDAFDG